MCSIDIDKPVHKNFKIETGIEKALKLESEH